MFYFSIMGDQHVFTVPLDYLEKVCSYFYRDFIEDPDRGEERWVVRVYATFDKAIKRIRKIELVLPPDSRNFSSVIMIYFDYGKCTITNPFDISEVIWDVYFYRSFVDTDHHMVLRLKDNKTFELSEFFNDYMEDISGFNYFEPLFTREELYEALERDLPF